MGSLFIGCAGCKELTNISLEAFGMHLPASPSLCRVELRFQGNKNIDGTGVAALARGLAALPLLRCLNLDFKCCRFDMQSSATAMESLVEATGPLMALEWLQFKGLDVRPHKQRTKKLSEAGQRALQLAFACSEGE